MQKKDGTFLSDLKSVFSEGNTKGKISDEVGSFTEPFKNLFSPVDREWSSSKDVDYSNDERFCLQDLSVDSGPILDMFQKVTLLIGFFMAIIVIGLGYFGIIT